MTISKRSVVLFVAALTFGAAFPLMAQQMLPGTVIRTSDGTRVEIKRVITFKDRADYNRALQLYDVLLQQGKTGLVKPDINDRSTIDVYLKNVAPDIRVEKEVRTDPISTTDYVKPPEDVVSDEALSDQERAELNRATKTGRCYMFPGFSSSYMTLCKQFTLGKKVLDTSGMGNDIFNLKLEQKAKLRGSSGSPANIYENLKDNRTNAVRAPYGKSGGREYPSRFMSSSSSSSTKVGY